MTDTRHDDLEVALRELFDRQHHAIEPPGRDWDPADAVAVVDLEHGRAGARRRLGRALIAATAVAATIAVAVGVVYTVGAGSKTHSGRPTVGSSGPADTTLSPGACRDGNTPATFACNPQVRWQTPQVHLEGTGFSILISDAHGARDFVAADPEISVHSDPGDANYQTLELEWQEHGVPQRWYLYFASDGKDWWVTEMRTYDGSPGGEWVYFGGTRFKTPLGSAWSGDIDLTATDHGVTSRLRMHVTGLQAFLTHGPAIPTDGAATASAS